ncbi:MAG TPA: M90 family metallopeptidase [Solimonas sp.]|nr:M90 family metallopeptidase [Solimonas sp.]
MTPALLVIAALFAIIGFIHVRKRSTRRRRAPPADWRVRLWRDIPQAAIVPPPLQAVYEQRVEQFLFDKRFIGCGGLSVDDDMRLAVAALACLLALRDGEALFPAVHSVLLYPDAFLVHRDEPDELGLVDDGPVEQIGESWQGDRVVLSWADVEAALAGDAVNVVVHEFAHQLDDADPRTEGAPPLADYAQWSTVMRREYERLQRHRRPPVFDPYGADSPGEFFGVVSEAFIQRPQETRRHHAELYALLADYYRLDPAARPPQWRT